MKRIQYWILFGVESAGMFFILYEALPLYRRLARGPIGDRPGAYLWVPVLCATIVMQACYWSKRTMRFRIKLPSHPLLAHVLLFISRLSFIFAGAIFSVTAFMRSADTRLSPIGLVVLLAATFAQFCYARELETLARAMETETRNAA